jgi:GTP-binding protein
MDMQELPTDDRTRLTFEAPTRGLIGFKTAFSGITQGEGILNRAFLVRAPTLDSNSRQAATTTAPHI